MAAPTFIQEAETSWTPRTGVPSGKLGTSRNYNAGDVLVAFGGLEDFTFTGMTIAMASLSWTTQQSHLQASSSIGYLWSAVDAVGHTGVQPTISCTGAGSADFGGNVLTFRSSDGIGASAKATISSPIAPTLDLTTTQDNSAIVMVCIDWNAIDGTGHTYRTPGGAAFTELTYDNTDNTTIYVPYGGYYADVGAAGLKTVGLTIPSTSKPTIMAIEVKGTAGGSPGVEPRDNFEPTRIGPF